MLFKMPEQKQPELQRAVKVIHDEVMSISGNNPALNGCGCPHCHGEKTYDIKYVNNYYFGCIDCQQVVAIWIESDISNKSGEPWFVLPLSSND